MSFEGGVFTIKSMFDRLGSVYFSGVFHRSINREPGFILSRERPSVTILNEKALSL